MADMGTPTQFVRNLLSQTKARWSYQSLTVKINLSKCTKTSSRYTRCSKLIDASSLYLRKNNIISSTWTACILFFASLQILTDVFNAWSISCNCSAHQNSLEKPYFWSSFCCCLHVYSFQWRWSIFPLYLLTP